MCKEQVPNGAVYYYYDENNDIQSDIDTRRDLDSQRARDKNYWHSIPHRKLTHRRFMDKIINKYGPDAGLAMGRAINEAIGQTIDMLRLNTGSMDIDYEDMYNYIVGSNKDEKQE